MLKQSAVITLILAGSLWADNIVNLSVGPTWPDAQKAKMLSGANPKAVWNVSGSWGKVFEKRIIIGAKADLSWKVERYQGTFWKYDTLSTSPLEIDTMYTSSDNIYRKKRIFMLPLCGWLAIDPIPQYRLHPVINAQVGYNSLFWSESNYDDGTGIRKDDKFKYYNGFYSKFGVDAMYDLGKQASIFMGFEYQIAPLYYRDGDKLEQTNFNSPEIRFGVSFLY